MVAFLRKKCRDPLKNGLLSQERLSELVSEKLNKPYSRNDIGEWENNKSTIRHTNRELLIALLSSLAQCGGIENQKEADDLLCMGDYRALNTEEKRVLVEWSEKELDQNESMTQGYIQPIPGRTLNPVVLSEEGSPRLAPAIPPQGIFGREKEIADIVKFLALDDEFARDVPPIALRGIAGVGKTTIAIAIAHDADIQHVFRDGVLWVNLGPYPDIMQLLRLWGQALGLDLTSEPDETICRERIRAALSPRKMLLFIDDVWEAAHGVSFLVGGLCCRSLITTRAASVANDLVTRSRVLSVDVLTPDASLQILRSLAPAAVAMEESRARFLCERLGYLPLAITLAGRLLANETEVPSRMKRSLQELIDQPDARMQLFQSEGRTGLDGEIPVPLKDILGLSVRRLKEPDQERFALLSCLPGRSSLWNIADVASICNCTVRQAEDTVSHYIQEGLVESRGEQYQMHTLFVDYAACALGKRKDLFKSLPVSDMNGQILSHRRIHQPVVTIS
jgi:hypothetical protein